MTANGSFAVNSLDHARLSARKFAQKHVFPQINAAFPIQRPRMFLSSAIHDKPPRGAGPRKAAFSRNRRKRMDDGGRVPATRAAVGAASCTEKSIRLRFIGELRVAGASAQLFAQVRRLPLNGLLGDFRLKRRRIAFWLAGRMLAEHRVAIAR